MNTILTMTFALLASFNAESNQATPTLNSGIDRNATQFVIEMPEADIALMDNYQRYLPEPNFDLANTRDA